MRLRGWNRSCGTARQRKVDTPEHGSRLARLEPDYNRHQWRYFSQSTGIETHPPSDPGRTLLGSAADSDPCSHPRLAAQAILCRPGRSPMQERQRPPGPERTIEKKNLAPCELVTCLPFGTIGLVRNCRQHITRRKKTNRRYPATTETDVTYFRVESDVRSGCQSRPEVQVLAHFAKQEDAGRPIRSHKQAISSAISSPEESSLEYNLVDCFHAQLECNAPLPRFVYNYAVPQVDPA
jgi:hypothetical protein